MRNRLARRASWRVLARPEAMRGPQCQAARAEAARRRLQARCLQRQHVATRHAQLNPHGRLQQQATAAINVATATSANRRAAFQRQMLAERAAVTDSAKDLHVAAVRAGGGTRSLDARKQAITHRDAPGSADQSQILLRTASAQMRAAIRAQPLDVRPHLLRARLGSGQVQGQCRCRLHGDIQRTESVAVAHVQLR